MPRAKTQDLPGTEAVKIPALSKALERYEDKKEERQEALKSEVELKGKVIDLMVESGLTAYRDGDLLVELVDKSKQTIKVKHLDGGEEE